MRKLILLGDQGSGKTRLVQHLSGQTASSASSEFISHSTFFYNDRHYSICDTHGLRTDSLRIFIEDSDIVLILYDTTKIDGFESILRWFRLARKYGNSPVILVGTKYSVLESYPYHYYLAYLSTTYLVQHHKINVVTNYHINELLERIHTTPNDSIPTIEEECCC